MISVAMIVLRVVAIVVHAPLEPHWPRGDLDHPTVVAQLSQIPGQHLVIVRYGPHHNVDHDWIHNEPDMDNSSIIWARDMGDDKNQELLRYFSGRHAWLMQGDDLPPRLEPYR
jgi:hypothetical protein